MTWEEAVEIRVKATGHERYRALCQEDYPDHLAWRAEMIRQAGGVPEPSPPKPAFPSLAKQASNFIGTMGQFAASGFALADEAERERRLAICRACEFLSGGRCLRCGCNVSLKSRIAKAHCPVNLW